MLESFLAKPLVWLSNWSGQVYNGEVRNGLAAHIGWGWALTLTLGLLFDLGVTGALIIGLYGIFREVQDAQYNLSNWNRKSTVDLITWLFGCLIGVICLM